MFCSYVLPLLVAAAAPHADVLESRFQPRAYFTEARRVGVMPGTDALVVRALPSTSPADLARAAERAALKLSADDAALVQVTGAWVARKHGLFVVDVMPGVPARVLEHVARTLLSTDGVLDVYPALAREDGRAFHDERLVVTAAPGQLEAAMKDVAERVGGRMVRHTRIQDTVLWAVGDHAGRDAVTASNLLRGVASIRSAEPDLYREYALTASVDDPMHAQQWHLHRPAANQPVPGTGQIFAHTAWEFTKGNPDVLIAIFDSGMDTAHEDLAPNIVSQFDPSAGDENASAECSASADGAGEAPGCPAEAPYRESHGTAVAGVAAARGDNATGVSGVCPTCSIMAVRLLGDQVGSGLSTAESFTRAVDEGAWVINNSWGPGRSRYFPLSMAERTAFDHARTAGRGGKGTVIVFAAGNSTAPVSSDPYASHPYNIAVAASTNLDDWAVYSNYGPEVDIAAPSLGGVAQQDNYGLVTADYSGLDGYSSSAYTTDFSGTSAASPVVAGVAGLLLASKPDLTAEQVRILITSTADKILADKLPWPDIIGADIETLWAYDENGHSVGFGYGRINAGAALAAAQQPLLAGAACPVEGCTHCVNNRCQPDCTAQADCPDGTFCTEGTCQIPINEPGTVGSPCTPDCERCTTALDTEGFAQRICTLACTADDECPVGFDCRITTGAGEGVCAVGNRSAGNRNNGTNCRSDLFFSALVTGNATGQTFCTDTCFADEPGACPYGWHCGSARCTCDATGGFGCRQYTCTEGPGTWDTDLCFPDLNYGLFCDENLDCAAGFYCNASGLCAPDDRQGCSVCKECQADDECGAGETCYRRSFQDANGVCTIGCDGTDTVGGPSTCPGDSVCTEVVRRNVPIKLCLSPGGTTNTPCRSGFECTVACRDDVPCADGKVCEQGACVDPPPPPDAGPMPEADAGTTPPPGGGGDTPGNGIRVAGCNCLAPSSLPGPSAVLGALGAVLVATRRRRR